MEDSRAARRPAVEEAATPCPSRLSDVPLLRISVQGGRNRPRTRAFDRRPLPSPDQHEGQPAHSPDAAPRKGVRCGANQGETNGETLYRGSTGAPWEILYSRLDSSIANISWLRPQLAHGFYPWHRRFEISGPHNVNQPKRWYQRAGLLRRDGVSIFEEPAAWLSELASRRPDVVWGYSGSLRILARVIVDQGGLAHNPKLVFGVSDLLDDEGRALIAKAFGSKLIDLYGSAETGCLAWQCPTCPGYHLNSDTVITEFLSGAEPAPPGTAGRVVVTNLHSFGMPMIRYELGDIGCPAPSRLPVVGPFR